MKQELVETQEIKNIKEEINNIEFERKWFEDDLKGYGYYGYFLLSLAGVIPVFLTFIFNAFEGGGFLLIYLPCLALSIFLNIKRVASRDKFKEAHRDGKFSLKELDKLKLKIKRIEFLQNRDFNLNLVKNFVIEFEKKLNKYGIKTPKKYIDLTSIEVENKKTTQVQLVAFVTNNKFIYAFKALNGLIELNESLNDENLDKLLRFSDDMELLTNFALSSVEVIDFDDIYYWKVEGQLKRDTIISGGGSSGGGVSLGGALLGGILAGDAGMILGGREKLTVNPVYTKIEEQDERVVELVYKKNEENRKMVFPFSDVDFFKLNLPQKTPDVANMILKKGSNKVNSVNDGNEIEIKIKKLESLLSQKIITQEEFDKKRKDLIDAI